MAGARLRIAHLVTETPTLPSALLSRIAKSPVILKLENLQVTGSFKVRGAANRLLALDAGERERGVVTCSSGNHGRAVAYVAERLGIPATVCVPEWVDASKLEAIRRHGAETVIEGTTYDEAEARAREIQTERGMVTIHPFDDPAVVAGQGTVGVEFMEQRPALGTLVVPVSGGGLIAGIAIAAKAVRPDVCIVGVSAKNASVMVNSLREGRPIVCPEEPTVANALAGGIGLDNRHTFRLVRDYVDEHVVVSEEEIMTGMAVAASEHKLVVEGGGAVAFAAVLASKLKGHPGDIGVLISGGNVRLSDWWDVVRGRAVVPSH